jgi:D-glycerate 3-kinase
MKEKIYEFSKVKKKYLKFIKSQEVLGEPFRDKLGQLNNFYLPISKMINKNYLRNKKTRIIGLAGGQGSGKSTISQLLKIILKTKFDLETVVFSIDDFYKTSQERKKMAKKINHLFLTRGVPGTHDSKLLHNCLKNLKKNYFKNLSIPKFDKSVDDRFSRKKWTKIFKKPNIIIFEGWCVGAKPQKNKDLIKPINKLEKLEDKNLIWRKKVNNELKNDYKKIFNLIDDLIFLQVPSFKYVYKWRLLQEKKLKKKSKGKKIMNKNEIQKFIMFYERITRNMIKTLGNQAKILINIDAKHRLKSIKFN